MAAIDMIPGRYVELKTIRNQLKSNALKQVENDVAEYRNRFEDLVWEAYQRDGERISAIADAMGGSRTSVYDIIKKREDLEERLGKSTLADRIEVEWTGEYKLGNKAPIFRIYWENYELESGETITLDGKIYLDGGSWSSTKVLTPNMDFRKLENQTLPYGNGKLYPKLLEVYTKVAEEQEWKR